MSSPFLVTYKPGSPSQDAPGLNKAKIRKHFSFAPIVLVDLDEKEVDALLRHPHVASVEHDGTVSIPDGETSESETSTAAERAPWGITKVRAAEVHARGVKGAGVKVAVIDTGIDFNHPDLAAIYKGGVNFVTPGTPPMDDHNHGTHCSGTLAGVLNDAGIFGVAPSVDLYAVKVLNSSGSGSWSAVISAYEWCVQNGIHVTSNSYGGSAGSVALETALNAAVDAGLLMVFAAGNNGTSVLYPAKYAKAIAISATDQNDLIASFSSRGPEVALAAPGVSIESTIRNGLYGTMSGTSMACPHAAGGMSLALSKGFTAAEVKTRLTTTQPDKGDPGRDPLYGWGRLDAYALSFGNDPTMPVFRSPVAFDASSSFDPDGSIMKYTFETSDGRTFDGPVHTITFPPGTFVVVLQVQDDKAAVGVTQRQFQIEADPLPPANVPPVAKFTMNGV